MAVANLPEQYRNALTRKYVDGESLETLAGELGISVDATKSLLARARRAGNRVVVLYIPLLFETGWYHGVDKIVVVSAPRAVQLQRVRRRRKMSLADISAIIARQMPDAEKRRRADVVVHTGLSRHYAQRALRRFVRTLRA